VQATSLFPILSQKVLAYVLINWGNKLLKVKQKNVEWLENEFYEPDCIIAIKLFLRRTLQRFIH